MLKLTSVEIVYIRLLLYKDIVTTGVGKYTTGNEIAKKIDKYMEVGD